MDGQSKSDIRKSIHLENKKLFSDTQQYSYKFTQDDIPQDFWEDEVLNNNPEKKINSPHFTITSGANKNIHFIECTTDDCIKISQQQNKNRGSSPKIRTYAVNFANPYYPAAKDFAGGTQEEELFQQYPDLCFSLINQFDELYPIGDNKTNGNHTTHIVITENVPRIRENFEDGYLICKDKNIRPTFITSAAPQTGYKINKPKNSVYDKYQPLIRENLDMIFGCCYGVNNNLIVGAWGCGAFAPFNPETRDDYIREVASDIIGYCFKYSAKYNNIFIPVPMGYNPEVYNIFKETFEIYDEKFYKFG